MDSRDVAIPSRIVTLLDMQRFYAENYVGAARLLEMLANYANEQEAGSKPENPARLVAIISDIESHFNDIGLGVSLQHARELKKMMEGSHHNWNRINTELFQLYRNFDRELKMELFFHIERSKMGFVNPSAPLFGDDVEQNFPSTQFDIVEAAKCLAFDRGTAAVFHLMRVMEHGLKALAIALDIEYAPSWDGYFRKIKTGLEEKNNKKPEPWKKREPFYRAALGDLERVKLAWRNEVMHTSGKFTIEESEQIFHAVRLFMQRIASELSEYGWKNKTKKKAVGKS